MKLTFKQIISRLTWIKTQPKHTQKFFLAHVNDRGFWELVKFHSLNLN